MNLKNRNAHPRRRRLSRTAAAIGTAAALTAGGSMIGAGSASAAGQDFVHGSCTFRLSVFSDWGKAAGSNRDQNGNCGNLTVTLYYGVGGFPTWSTSKGPTNTDYLKVNAGYYDPNRTTGKAGSSSTQTIYY